MHLEETRRSRAESAALASAGSWAFPGRLLRVGKQGAGWLAAHPSVRMGWSDACKATTRLVQSIRVPTRQELVDFLGYQALVNGVAWCAGLAAVGIVTWFFEERSLHNLWGLIPSDHRTLVSADDYRMILSLASFCAGLTTTVLVRHVLLRWIAEVRAVRLERRERARSSSGAPTRRRFDADAPPDDDDNH